ncbi:hypothetical protein EV360DRAFT_72442 [Lentinula raphanica]|nr:hypothetical protein EV360DRAFT_72442 [Lentinula raphanica]
MDISQDRDEYEEHQREVECMTWLKKRFRENKAWESGNGEDSEREVTGLVQQLVEGTLDQLHLPQTDSDLAYHRSLHAVGITLPLFNPSQRCLVNDVRAIPQYNSARVFAPWANEERMIRFGGFELRGDIRNSDESKMVLEENGEKEVEGELRFNMNCRGELGGWVEGGDCKVENGLIRCQKVQHMQNIQRYCFRVNWHASPPQ